MERGIVTPIVSGIRTAIVEARGRSICVAAERRSEHASGLADTGLLTVTGNDMTLREDRVNVTCSLLAILFLPFEIGPSA